MRKLIYTAAFAACAMFANAASAAPVTFDVTTGTNYANLGAGINCIPNSTTTICLQFTSSAVDPAAFALSAGGTSAPIQIGTLRLQDTGSDGNNFDADEVSANLSFNAILNLASPFSGSVTQVATKATAIVGAWSDAAVDLMFTFDPVLTNFGFEDSGQFRVDFGSISFTDRNQTIGQSATITLLSEPRAAPAVVQTPVPEPAAIGLFGMGLLGLAGLRRRKA